MKEFKTGICYNCGADRGLHHFETENCPMNGIEEIRFNHNTGKVFNQEWQSTVFEDSGIKKLHDSAPDLLEALQLILKHHSGVRNEHTELKNTRPFKLAEKAINKALE